ncbi:ABC transporter ATP-binding protein [Gloeobacter kilaueensis]|uniref:Spermidine/putrescine import ATP-binding protein PotA n=1 Tax=Gloeobacter kilaueensis (strain ATCC BAA-2537 / CCAP 1431/1 / ULC 316 / JS1) TaxID=1183438 RepID=U5QJE4_GLOK1|nr:ABC transporter ATP-binding protein [Gloeobacter kilaueensis]AGY58988.1 spermidine/putrescine ABC transporter ATPase subunit [Gloeobacter kilaueensis JS1]
MNVVELDRIVKSFCDPAGNRLRAVDGVSLSVQAGEFFSFLGASGCGKTTLLRLIAGFEAPDSGTIAILGEPMAGVPPYRRPVNTVFQSYALFPHLNVYQNIAFGLEMERLDRREVRSRVEQTLELVRLEKLASRRPDQLSGGQKQRVALARALAKRPAVLLLDEPLSALDLQLRRQLRTELKALQRQTGITFIFVTHDQDEALSLSDRIAVICQGQIAQVGRAGEIYERPTSRFVAEFVGETNWLAGTVKSEEAAGGVAIFVPALNRRLRGVATVPLAPGAPVAVSIRPEKLQLLPVDASPSAGNWFSGTLLEASYSGAQTLQRVALEGGLQLRVLLQNRADTGNLSPGTSCRLAVDWRDTVVLPDSAP